MKRIRKLSIIIPVFNEERTIDEILQRIFDISWRREIDVVVVDDGSTDGTQKKLEKWQKFAKVLFKDKNEGKGSAIKKGLEVSEGDWIVVQDADLEYNPADILKLIEVVESGVSDVVFGSRLFDRMRKRKFDDLNLIFFTGGVFINTAFNVFLGTNFTDVTTCYKLFPRRYIPHLLKFKSQDFVFDVVDMTWCFVEHFEKIVEVPVSYRPRFEGKKITWKHGIRCFLRILQLSPKVDMKNRRERFERAMRFVKDGDRIADLGCGPSYDFLRLVLGKISFGFGFDKNAESFRDGKLWIEKGDMEKGIPHLEERFDRIFLLAVLEHLSDTSEVFSWVSEHLSDKGEVIITTPHPATCIPFKILSYLGILDRNDIEDHKRYWTLSEVEKEARRWGLEVKKQLKFRFGLNQLFVLSKAR